MEVAHELHGLTRGFAEARAGIDADALARNAGCFEHGGLAAQVFFNLGHDVVVVRIVLHGGRLAEHMHDDKTRIAVFGDFDHSGIAEARYVIDDCRAGFNARASNFGVARIDAHAQAQIGQLAHYIEHARELLFDGHFRRTRTRRLAAHVDYLSAFVDHLTRIRHRFGKTVVLATVRERIGRHVQNAHNDGACGVEFEVRAFPHHARFLPFLYTHKRVPSPESEGTRPLVVSCAAIPPCGKTSTAAKNRPAAQPPAVAKRAAAPPACRQAPRA